MLTDFSEAHNSFLELKVAPPVLNPVSCPSLDNHVNWILFERASEERCTDILLDHSNVRSAIK